MLFLILNRVKKWILIYANFNKILLLNNIAVIKFMLINYLKYNKKIAVEIKFLY